MCVVPLSTNRSCVEQFVSYEDVIVTEVIVSVVNTSEEILAGFQSHGLVHSGVAVVGLLWSVTLVAPDT